MSPARPRPLEAADRDEWLRLRLLLWPGSAAEHAAEIDGYLAAGDPAQATFVLDRGGGRLGGFLEAGERPYAEGCEGTVGYIEGWFVEEDLRGQGLGRRLVEAAESWAISRGRREMASDALIDNEASIRAHGALGYEEVERIACFRKALRPLPEGAAAAANEAGD